MNLRHLILVPFLSLLIACGHGDKYPYPPQFVSVEDISLRALPAPPAQYSPEYNRGIKTIQARQAKLTDAQKETLRHEDHISPEMIILPVLGEQYTADAYPELYALMRHAASDAWRIGDSMQDYWKSPRPWTVEPRVQLLVPSITRPGYPSGHTTTNSVWAHVLSEIFPEHRSALFARANDIGYHRVDGGAHFPHDIEAGKRLARIIYTEMRQSPAYQSQLAIAEAEVDATPRLPVNAAACLTSDPNSERESACE